MMETAFSQMMTSATEIYLSVVYIVCVFLVVTYRPQQIANPERFRLSYHLFAAHLLISPVVNLLVYFMAQDVPGQRRANAGVMFLVHIGSVAGRILFAMSLVVALGALTTRGSRSATAGPHESE